MVSQELNITSHPIPNYLSNAVQGKSALCSVILAWEQQAVQDLARCHGV